MDFIWGEGLGVLNNLEESCNVIFRCCTRILKHAPVETSYCERTQMAYWAIEATLRSVRLGTVR